MNAVVMVEGWVNGGIDGARSQLETFWRKASVGSALSSLQRGLLRQLLGYWRNQPWMTAVTQNLGPYQVNPLNINPLRAAIDALIDFDLVRASTDVKIFISATNVWTGKITIFRNSELTADHLMASARIPTVFQAVEIDGVPYWDGGDTRAIRRCSRSTTKREPTTSCSCRSTRWSEDRRRGPCAKSKTV